jgi:hypothetical protein
MEKQKKAVSADRSAVLTQALAETANRLELGPTEIGRIVGVSQPTASRLLKGEYLLKESAKEWELSAHLVRLYRSLVLSGRQRRQLGPRLAAIGEQGLRRPGTHRADQAHRRSHPCL